MILNKMFINSLRNIPGWRTNRKIVIIESDDWGTIRMPSKEVFDSLLRKGVRVDNCPYCRYDTLASEDDLSALYDVLTSVKDRNGCYPIITANAVVANPNFDKIRESNYEEYYYEPFTETLKRYPNHKRSFDLWKEGIRLKIFRPQFHGREHLNFQFWLQSLRSKNQIVLDMFDANTWGIDVIKIPEDMRKNFMSGFNYKALEELNQMELSIKEGAKLFYSLFGYKSKTAIANCYIWDERIESSLKDVDVHFLQGNPFQTYPVYKQRKEGKKGQYHFLGQKNKDRQIYGVRNCYFEPSQTPNVNWVDDCLSRMQIAFRWKKPAIICMHRLNVIGGIRVSNRDENLFILKKLLSTILKKWPDVEFLSTDQLAMEMEK